MIADEEEREQMIAFARFITEQNQAANRRAKLRPGDAEA
jgi:hypothetical protein